MDLLTPIIADKGFRTLSESLDQGRRCIATGSVGSSLSMLAAALSRTTRRRVLVVCAHVDESEDVLAEMQAIGAQDAEVFPALELAPGESSVSAELFANRAAMIAQIRSGVIPPVLITPIAALMQPVPSAQRIDELVRDVSRGERFEPKSLLEWLSGAGYERVDVVEFPGQFASRGGIIDIFPSSGSGGQPVAVRLDFFGDELESIAEIDLETMGSDRRIDSVLLGSAGDVQIKATSDDRSVLEYLSSDTIVLLAETFEVVEQGRGYYERISDGRSIFGPPAVLKLLETRFHALAEVNQFSAGKSGADTRVDLPVSPLPPFEKEVAVAIAELGELRQRCDTVVLACGSEGEFARLGELLDLYAPGVDIRREILDIRRGYLWEGSDQGAGIGRYALVPSGQLLHRSSVRRRMQKIKAGRAMDTFLDIQPDDYVVHSEHGIARFVGLTVLDASGTAKTRERYPLRPEKTKKRKEDQEEYLTLEFAGRSRLHVPCSQIDLVQKYVGGFRGKPPLSSIGGKKWKAQKQRVRESVKDLASEMLRVRAAREHVPGFCYPQDTPMFQQFEAEFPYSETEDQLSAMIEIKKDMQSQRPMDRLICGDVGFGKTEMAIRAAFKAVEAGRQVAVLVPTTVLAEQHERTIRDRFADYPFRVESLSRFKTPKQIRQTLSQLALGRVDVVVGTHRLLSDDVRFADLGMVIIDEEQRFGVEHKEKLLRLRLTVDVLTLSATPIPRTLHMSMLGLRDISSLTTPPVDRRSIVTEVIPFNQHRVARAIQRELAREGQVYFVHNRVHNIESVADNIRQLVPDARIIIGHGQMNPHDLEQVMIEFMTRRADVLVSTTIIESGIDIPTANTMIINDADRFGLSELHQLRGRVGRSHHRAYCYLLLPEDRTVKEVAQKRLKAIEEYSMLGAGFKIAMRDLEIRGAGNLLGAEQSGHIAAVGYEMYCQLLDQTVTKLTSEGDPDLVEHTSVDIGVFGYIPKAYIPSDSRRIEAYRRLANSRTQQQLDQLVADLTSAYSDPPELVRRLVLRARVRVACQALFVRSVGIRDQDIVMLTAQPNRVEHTLENAPARIRVVQSDLAQTNARSEAGNKLGEVYIRPNEKPRSPMQQAKSLLRWLEGQSTAPGHQGAGRADASL